MILSRAKQTAGLVHAQRVAGLRRPRRRLPRQIPPKLIEAEYRKRLLRYVDVVLVVVQPLFDELPSILAEVGAERRDADPRDRLRARQQEAKRRMQEMLNQPEIDALAREFARRTETHQRIQLQRQTRAALGADVFTSDRRIPGLVNGFVVENAQLITSIPEKLMLDIADMTARAVAQGVPWPKLAGEISARFGMARDRARLIARDQVGKLYGQINAERQKELGVKRFIWRTVRDERVRGDPDGKYPRAEPSHFHREGKTYSYDDPPDGELPGEPINCRCYAEPVFDDVMDELDAFAARAPADLPRPRRRGR